MAEKRASWCLIPPGILCRRDLLQSEKILIGRIIGLTNERGYCYASNTYLGEQIGITKGSAANMIMDLHKRGFLKIDLIRNENHHITERRIYPIYEDLPIHPQVNTPSPTGEYPIHPQVNTPIHPQVKGSIRDKSIRERNNTLSCGPDLNEKEKFFEEFWNIYPPRRGKKLQKKEAKSLFMDLKSVSVAPVMQAVRNYAVSKTVTDGYAKDAVRFLKNDYWQDWLEPELARQKEADDDRLAFLRQAKAARSGVQNTAAQ